MRPPESFINQPIRSLQTMLHVIAQRDSRLPNVIPDGIYGKNTISAVNSFQQIHGLPITGITDQATWDKIAEVYETDRIYIEPAESIEILLGRNEALHPGDSNAYVYFLQVMLLRLAEEYPSLNAPEITGIYGQETAAAVKQFQLLNDLPPNGETDKRTWKNLVNQFTLLMHRYENELR